VLGQSASAKRVDLAEVVAGVLALGQSLAISRDVVVRTGHLAAGLNAAIHLSALRQLLITILGEMIESMQGGELILEVKEEEDHAAVWIRCPSAAVNRPSSDLIHEITVAYGGSFSWHDSGENRGVALRIPVADRSFAVLVVDDNTELVHFYRHYTQDTPYRITHLTDGARLLDVIQTERPDVIVLDVMLPGVDGWDLLVQLRRQSASRAVPVIVCSVIRAENLALTMGAAHYLPKPVRRQEFIRALDRVLSSRSEAAGLDDGHSASAGTG
jgi:CheY-like chemotaxis protein